MTQIDILRNKMIKQRELYVRLRAMYPESARQCKRNILEIVRQIRLLKLGKVV